LRKLQAVQNGKNNVGQARLHRRLFLLFYRATARQREVAQRIRAGTVCDFTPLQGDSPLIKAVAF